MDRRKNIYKNTFYHDMVKSKTTTNVKVYIFLQKYIMQIKTIFMKYPFRAKL